MRYTSFLLLPFQTDPGCVYVFVLWAIAQMSRRDNWPFLLLPHPSRANNWPNFRPFSTSSLPSHSPFLTSLSSLLFSSLFSLLSLFSPCPSFLLSELLESHQQSATPCVPSLSLKWREKYANFFFTYFTFYSRISYPACSYREESIICHSQGQWCRDISHTRHTVTVTVTGIQWDGWISFSFSSSISLFTGEHHKNMWRVSVGVHVTRHRSITRSDASLKSERERNKSVSWKREIHLLNRIGVT